MQGLITYGKNMRNDACASFTGISIIKIQDALLYKSRSKSVNLWIIYFKRMYYIVWWYFKSKYWNRKKVWIIWNIRSVRNRLGGNVKLMIVGWVWPEREFGENLFHPFHLIILLLISNENICLNVSCSITFWQHKNRSAPLAGNVLTFMRATLGCIIVEGWAVTRFSSSHNQIGNNQKSDL